MHYFVHYIAQQTGQDPKVKSPPLVPPKPKRDQSRPTIKLQTASAFQPQQLDLSLEQPQDPLSLEQHQDPSSSEQPQNPSSSEQPQDPSLLEQPQNSSSLEYITLREMLADLVDLLAGNAPVITQLNNHLFSSGLIAKAIHLNSPSHPYNRATELINAVLATLENHPNPNSAFTSLITTLHKVGLTTIATKLMECLSKFMHH